MLTRVSEPLCVVSAAKKEKIRGFELLEAFCGGPGSEITGLSSFKMNYFVLQYLSMLKN